MSNVKATAVLVGTFFVGCVASMAKRDTWATSVAMLHGEGRIERYAVSQPTWSGGNGARGRVVMMPSSGGAPLAIRPSNQSTGFGLGLANVGDVNGDAMDDLGVLDIDVRALLEPTVSENIDKQASVCIYSGSDGSLLTRVVGEAQRRFGAAMSSVGDIDGDGLNDVIVGIPGDPGKPADHGEIMAISGVSGQELYRVRGHPGDRNFGSAIAFADDQDGDGCRDYLVGAPRRTLGVHSDLSSSVYVISGRRGSVLSGIRPQGRNAQRDYDFGASLLCLHDVDGDGVSDFVIAAPGAIDVVDVARHIDIVAGDSGHLLRSIEAADIDATVGSQYFGVQLASIRDIDGDGQNDILVVAVSPHPPAMATTLLGFSSQTSEIRKRVCVDKALGWKIGTSSGQEGKGSSSVVLNSVDVGDGQLFGPSWVLSVEAWTLSPLLEVRH